MARVIVVDDSPIVRTLVSASLTEEGHEVLEAEDGQVFLDMTQHDTFDAILLDIMMPVKNGVDALREFRSRGDETPVIVITSKNEATLSDVFEGLQVSVYMVKPLSPESLVKSINSLCG